MIREPSSENPLDQASKRLDQALRKLEQRLARQGEAGGDLFGAAPDRDVAELAAELAESRAREQALEAAGAEASAALGRAIAEIRSALSQDDEPGEEAPPWDDQPHDRTREA
jgi:hypothetical protein